MLARRTFIQAAAGAALALPLAAKGQALGGNHLNERFADRIAEIERQSGGRLGVAVHDTGTGAHFAHRGDERFPFCSTFKFLLAGATLHRVNRGLERLDRRVNILAADVVSNSPVTEKLIGGTATVGELCHATMTTSDNGAANALLHPIGGAPALTRFLRSIGDEVTRLDRIEPILNSSIPGDPRDTTSPNAMAANLQRLLLGNVLTHASRGELLGWMRANKTGDTRIRAGVPADWLVGDKTGAGNNGSNNDIAILLPPRRPPILLASYLTATKTPMLESHRFHADVARAVVGALA